MNTDEAPNEPADYQRTGTDKDDLGQLMQGYQQADPAAAALLVERVSPQIFRFFLAQVRQRARAEDLLQDFWLRVHSARQTYRHGEPVLPWLYAIARYTQIDNFRRRSRVSRHEIQTEALPDVSAAPVEEDRSGGELENLLSPLPASQRDVVVMLKVNGLSLEEVARATGTSVGSVKQKAHRAYETLRKVLGGSSQ